jgi:hypothetical protein
MAPTALFVIDIQVELARASTEIPHAKRIRDSAEAILAKARAGIDTARSSERQPELEIIIVQHEESPEGSLVRGSEAWELVFPPGAGERLVEKDVGGSIAICFCCSEASMVLTGYMRGYLCIESTSRFPT